MQTDLEIKLSLFNAKIEDCEKRALDLEKIEIGLKAKESMLSKKENEFLQKKLNFDEECRIKNGEIIATLESARKKHEDADKRTAHIRSLADTLKYDTDTLIIDRNSFNEIKRAFERDNIENKKVLSDIQGNLELIEMTARVVEEYSKGLDQKVLSHLETEKVIQARIIEMKEIEERVNQKIELLKQNGVSFKP